MTGKPVSRVRTWWGTAKEPSTLRGSSLPLEKRDTIPVYSPDVRGFIKALSDPNPSIRREGAKAIGKYGGGCTDWNTVIDCVVALLDAYHDDKNVSVKVNAIKALGRLGRKAAHIEVWVALEKAQQSGNKQLNEAAANSVPRIFA